MKRVISASRRTDLTASFPDWMAEAIRNRKALVFGPSGRTRVVDLDPDTVHTFVLWSKNFANLTGNRQGLRDLLREYAQLYFHFTVTGLGGTSWERDVPPAREALRQLEPLIAIAGHPGRVSLRFDPVITWREAGQEMTNLHQFADFADTAASLGIRDIRFSFAQWYGKSRRRAARQGFGFIDPPEAEKIRAAHVLAGIARERGLRLYSCSQNYLAAVPGVEPSACIDGRLLQSLHPGQEGVSTAKDRSQRSECRCTESVDIGSYTQACPHGCVYCYANPKA
ncbi:MAG: hypothetical protein A2W03_06920 [Candidatus Aminicenantes bacterium RBG_16_63_16]|nr:MAG: hypothetical protein A2W03_06920 [Candidatus Aminicenantes bacterium RBG_16_63_16]